MSWRSDLKGTLQNLFGIGGPSGPKLNNSSGIIEARNAGNNAYTTFRASRIAASGTTVNDIPTLVDLQSRVAVIEYSFDGVTPPTPGDNTGKFGFVHTTGGSYTAGQVVYDSGAALLLIPDGVVKHMTTAVAVTGTISLIDNGFYAYDDGVWILKGDGNSTSEGTLRVVEVAYTHNTTTVSSTTAIATGSRITQVANSVTTLFAGGTGVRTVLVELDGTTVNTSLMGVADSDLTTVENYIKDSIVEVDGTTVEPGTIKLTVSVPSGHTAGAGKIYVYYVKPNA